MPQSPSLPAEKAHGDTRSLAGVVPLVLIGAGLVGITFLPSVRALFGMGPPAMALGIGVALAGILAATATYHLAGPRSPAYRTADLVETTLIEVAILWLIFASGRPANPLFILYLIHAANAGRMPDVHRLTPWVFAALPVALAVALVVVRRDVAGAGYALLVDALAIYLLTAMRRTTEAVAAAVAERERLAAELAELRVAAERERIARDLHDGVAADLTAIAWRSELAAARVDGAARAELDAIIERARVGVRELRSVVWALRAEARGWDELAAWLRQRTAELCAGRAELRFDADDQGPRLDGERCMHLVRTAQEAVRNALHHGAARHITVTLAAGPPLVLRIVDDGVGLAPDAAERDGGLANLRRRAADLGGELRVTRREPGTGVELRVPLP